MIEGPGSGAGSGSIPLSSGSGSGSGRPPKHVDLMDTDSDPEHWFPLSSNHETVARDVRLHVQDVGVGLIAVLDELRIPQVVVLGDGAGAYIALRS